MGTYSPAIKRLLQLWTGDLTICANEQSFSTEQCYKMHLNK